MSTQAENAYSKPTTGKAGKKYRLVVSSAQDAARIIKDKLGDDAEVLSVKQIPGKGISRFIKAPQLEVIVWIPEQTQSEPEATEPQSEVTPQPQAPVYTEQVEPTQVPQSTAERASEGSIDILLQQAGFQDSFIMGYQAQDQDDNSLDTTVDRFKSMHRTFEKQFEALPQHPVHGKVAFLGTSSAGATTALCKYLTKRVIVENQQPLVVQYSTQFSDNSELLQLHADTLGISSQVWQPGIDKSLEDQLSFIDIPGGSLHDAEHWQEVQAFLDKQEIRTRVYVVNAIADQEILKANFRLAHRMKATHLVFTHLDELIHYGKLWPFLLKSPLTPLFFTHGKSLTSAYEEDLLGFLTHKTFPESLINA